jgi:hypothetical protein
MMKNMKSNPFPAFFGILLACACGSAPVPGPEQPVAGNTAADAAGAGEECDPSCIYVEDICVIRTATPNIFNDCPTRCCKSAATVADPDHDWITGRNDKCPQDPEDIDSFEDLDGCPDPDNDMDGILDIDDFCPNVPEDKDGFKDEDGCPDATGSDRDGDGIADDKDMCPDDPEDLDAFQDADGCPDPDNDGDGIMDVDDLCPNAPEDMDGMKDADGCPDP